MKKNVLNEVNEIRKMMGLINEEEFKVNMPLRLRGTFEGDVTNDPKEITIYLKYEPRLIPKRSASGELDFVFSYENKPPTPVDMMGSFNCGKEWVHLPGVSDVSEFYGKIYDDTALTMMKNYCKSTNKEDGKLIP